MTSPGEFVISLLAAAALAQGPVDAAQPQRSPAEPDDAATPGRSIDASTPSAIVAPAEDRSAEPAAEADEATVETDEDWGDEDGDGDEDWDGEDEDEDWDDDYDPLRDSPEAVRSQRRIAGGAVLIGVGALTAFGALGMGLSDPCAAPAGNSCSASARNRAALTMGLPGVAVLGAGVAVLVLGLRQRDRLRVDAQASRTGAGVRLSGRF